MLQTLSRFFSIKKLLLVLALLAVIIGGILFLRQEKESAPDLNRLSSDLSGGISCTVQLQRGDFRAQSLFSQSFIGESSLRFFSPPSLDGFEIRQSEGKTTLAWKGMSCDLSSQQLLSQSGAGLFMQILGQLSDGLDEQQIQIEPEEGSLYYRVVVIRAPLQGLCYTVRDAVDWLAAPTTRWFTKGSNHSPLQFC